MKLTLKKQKSYDIQKGKDFTLRTLLGTLCLGVAFIAFAFIPYYPMGGLVTVAAGWAAINLI